MEATAITKFARISPFKAREVTRLIQGKSYDEAYKLVTLANKKAAGIIKKTLQSAKANAENNHQATGDLVVKLAVIGEGPTMKRFRPKARGMAGRINKRTSHVKIILTDEF
ncbi:MAG: 50S ribosomal protein L22 [Lentisphaeraceae bacterium]|nr:50S ribosomal protein L22 [Lentisphaeraceae bacterium]